LPAHGGAVADLARAEHAQHVVERGKFLAELSLISVNVTAAPDVARRRSWIRCVLIREASVEISLGNFFEAFGNVQAEFGRAGDETGLSGFLF